MQKVTIEFMGNVDKKVIEKFMFSVQKLADKLNISVFISAELKEDKNKDGKKQV